MKKIYTVFFLVVFAKSNAQTITQAFNEPVIGDIDKNYRLDSSAYTSGLPVSPTGSNCVWNFSNLTGIFPMVVDSFIAPSAAIGATAVPSASYAQHRDLLYTFYKSTTTPPANRITWRLLSFFKLNFYQLCNYSKLSGFLWIQFIGYC